MEIKLYFWQYTLSSPESIGFMITSSLGNLQVQIPKFDGSANWTFEIYVVGLDAHILLCLRKRCREYMITNYIDDELINRWLEFTVPPW